MTCIVGVLDGKGGVVMGADSAGTNEYKELQLRADAKVFHLGPFLIGCTTSWRMNQLIRYTLKIDVPRPVENSFVHQFMATTFVDSVRDVLKAGGWIEKDKDRESGGTFLVGFQGRLFSVYDDFSVSEEIAEYEACGCGEQIARGSLYSTNGHPPKVRVKMALAASERFSAGVRGPFNILEQTNNDQ